jgi:hypothetical protein
VKNSYIIHALDGILSRYKASRDTTFNAPTAVRIITITIIIKICIISSIIIIAVIIIIILTNAQRESESLGSKRPEREANHSRPSSTEVKRKKSRYSDGLRAGRPGFDRRYGQEIFSLLHSVHTESVAHPAS